MSLHPDDGSMTAARPDPKCAGSDAFSTTHVDVGLTAYRRVTFIDQAIESVLAQTYPHWRLTICDNGPGGGDVERTVAERYLHDPRVSYRATGRELTLAENWTNALNQGTAPYVAVLQRRRPLASRLPARPRRRARRSSRVRICILRVRADRRARSRDPARSDSRFPKAFSGNCRLRAGSFGRTRSSRRRSSCAARHARP